MYDPAVHARLTIALAAAFGACRDPREASPERHEQPPPPAHAHPDALVAHAPQPIAIGMSFQTAIVLLDDGTLRAWGNGRFGLLGTGERAADAATPIHVPGITDATELVVSTNHPIACVHLRRGSWSCWGSGAALPGGVDELRVPAIEPAFLGARAVRFGGFASCMIRDTGNVACWGKVPPADRRDGPVSKLHDIPGLHDVIALSVDDPICALEGDGSLWCWGKDEYAQASGARQAWQEDRVVPAPTRVAGIDDAVELGATLDLTCVRRRSGNLACFGKPFAGAGIVAVPSTLDAHFLDAQRLDLCEVVPGKPARCLGSFASQPPLPSEPPRALATDYASDCEISTAGEVLCWGKNDLGQLGDGTLIERDTAKPVVGLVDPVPQTVPATATSAKARAPHWDTRPADCPYDARLEFQHLDVHGEFVVAAAFADDHTLLEIELFDHIIDPATITHPPTLVADQRAIRILLSNEVGKDFTSVAPGRFAMAKRGGRNAAGMVVQSNHVYADAGDARTGFGGTVTLSHLDAAWACGTLDVSGPGGRIHGRFAAEIVPR